MTKYVLVSQWVKIFETSNKAEAEKIMKEWNDKRNEYVERCMDNFEDYADNEIFLYEE